MEATRLDDNMIVLEAGIVKQSCAEANGKSKRSISVTTTLKITTA